MPDDKPQGLTHTEHQDVEELSAPVIYEVVRQQGEDELCRPDGSLFWSGIAAGITISWPRSSCRAPCGYPRCTPRGRNKALPCDAFDPFGRSECTNSFNIA